MDNADFDHIASDYDRDFSNTLIGKAQRKLVWNIMNRYYPDFANVNVLEVNCGTGVDAKQLAEKGAHLLATDISQEMINITQQRLKDYPNADAKVLDLKNILSVEGEYDLVFSNFGGLNCLGEKELCAFTNQVSEKIVSGGRLIMVIMPKNTAWEMLYFTSKLSPRNAIRRMKKGGTEANVDGKKIRTYYYNPTFFDQFKMFDVLSVSPIGLYVPPSYLENRFKQKAAKIEKYYQKDFSKFDKRALAKFADHYCIVLEKK